MKRRIQLVSLLVCLFLCLGLLKGITVSANVGDAYGFGSKSAALGGTGAGWVNDGYAAYSNPASLAQRQEQRLTLSYGLLYMSPNLSPINGVVVENSFNSDRAPGNPRVDSVDTATSAYRNTFGQVIGLSYHLFPEVFNFSLGVVAFLPIEQLAYMDTGEAYLPEYVMYRARTQRPQVELGAGAALGRGLHLGVGLHVAYSLTSNAPVFINTGDGTTSSIRFSASMKPKVSPYFGAYFSTSPKFSAGLVFRLPATYDNSMTLSSGARVFGKSAAIDFSFLANSVLYYDPMTLEMGASLVETAFLKTFVQLDYQFWSNFQVPALQMTQPANPCTTGDSSCGPLPSVSIQSLPVYSFINTWVPRVGQEIAISSAMTLRLGYAYRHSILNGISNGIGNYIDPPKHVLNAGVGIHFLSLPGLKCPADLDFHMSYQKLVSQTVVKGSPVQNEGGVANDPKIGSTWPDPSVGYQAGGNILGGGVSLSLAI